MSEGTGNIIYRELFRELRSRQINLPSSVIKSLGFNNEIRIDTFFIGDILVHDEVKKYLSSKKLLEAKIFPGFYIEKILNLVPPKLEMYSFVDLEYAIARRREKDNVDFSVNLNVDEFSLILKTTAENLRIELGKLFDERTRASIPLDTKIPLTIVETICQKLGFKYAEVLQNIEKKRAEEPLNHSIRLAKAAAIYNVSSAHIAEELRNKGFNVTDNGSYKLAPEMLGILEDEFDVHRKVKLQADKSVINKLSKLPEDIRANETISATALEKMEETNVESIVEPIQESSEIIEEKPASNHNFDTQIHLKMKSPIQKIIFGSPGTGKSYRVAKSPNSILSQLKTDDDRECEHFKTVFHPEYTYGDFMGKLLPLTNEKGEVTYNFYAGHFLKALALAYKKILENPEKPTNVALVIDEINRGNSAAIFGTIFQLLDRDYSGPNKGMSSYEVFLSDLEYDTLMERVLGTEISDEISKMTNKETKGLKGIDIRKKAIAKLVSSTPIEFLTKQEIKLPSNFSLIATMNTSDNSIYFMDSAFKRRWDWEFIDVSTEEQVKALENRKLYTGKSWTQFIDLLNGFIKQKAGRIRKIEDKQIGYHFIEGDTITEYDIKNKLLFFLWDSVFSNDKKPLEELLHIDGQNQLITFGDFVKLCPQFVQAISEGNFKR